MLSADVAGISLSTSLGEVVSEMMLSVVVKRLPPARTTVQPCSCHRLSSLQGRPFRLTIVAHSTALLLHELDTKNAPWVRKLLNEAGRFLGADVHSPVWLGKKDAALFDLAKTLMVAKSNRAPHIIIRFIVFCDLVWLLSQIYAILAKEKLHYITFELHNMPNRLIAAGEWGTWMHKTFDGVCSSRIQRLRLIIACIRSKTSTASFLFSPAFTATAITSSFVGWMLSLIEVVRYPLMPWLGSKS